MARITWTHKNTVFSEWFERDRANVGLETVNGKTIINLWDEDVTDFAETMKGLRQSWHDCLLEHANDCQLIPQA